MAEIKRISGGFLTALGILAAISLWVAWYAAASARLELQNSRVTPEAAEALTTFSDGALFVFLLCLIAFALLWGFFHVPLGHIAIAANGKVWGADVAGWKYHLFWRMLSLELVEMKSRNLKVPPFPIRSRSQAEFEMNVAVNWRPDPENIQAYIQHGKEAVAETLGNMITSRLSSWAYNDGPADWREALGAHDLSKEALVNELSHVPLMPRVSTTNRTLQNQDGQHCNPNEEYVAILSEPEPVRAFEPATSSLLVPGDIATYPLKPLGIMIGGLYVKCIEPRSGSKFERKNRMEEAEYNLPFEEQLARVERGIKNIHKLEEVRKEMLDRYPLRKAEINNQFDMLKTRLIDK